MKTKVLLAAITVSVATNVVAHENFSAHSHGETALDMHSILLVAGEIFLIALAGAAALKLLSTIVVKAGVKARKTTRK